MSESAFILEVKGLCTKSLKNINFAVLSGEIVAVIGTDIHRKNELIDAIAGLTNYEGKILLEGSSIDETRAVGRIGRFPHEHVPETNLLTTVAQSLKQLNLPEHEIMEKAKEALKALSLEELGEKTTKELTLLENKLFQLAYISASSPKIMLLKEPFEGLTPEEKLLLSETLEILKQKHTIILTSKRMSDVDAIADRILLLDDGEAVQYGKPNELLFEPANEVVSNITTGRNIFTAVSIKIVASGLAQVYCGDTLFLMVSYEGGRIEKVAVYPEGIKVFKHKPKNLSFNLFKALVKAVNEENGKVNLHLSLIGGGKLTASLDKTVAKASRISKEDQVYAWIDPTYVRTLVRM